MARIRVCGECRQPVEACVCPDEDSEPQGSTDDDGAEFRITRVLEGDPAESGIRPAPS
jgi:hypothetical protein